MWLSLQTDISWKEKYLFEIELKGIKSIHLKRQLCQFCRKLTVKRQGKIKLSFSELHSCISEGKKKATEVLSKA